MYFVYVLRCVDSSLYCGYTTDPVHRFRAHTGLVKGGAKYTKSRPPVKVEAVWSCGAEGDALSFERAVKKLSRAEKEILITDGAAAAAFPELAEKGPFRREPFYVGAIEEVIVRKKDEQYEDIGNI